MQKPKSPPSITTEGLATQWIIELLGGEEEFPATLTATLRQSITLFDDTYSRFKDSSLVGQLNNSHVIKNPPQELVDMFTFAHKMYDATGGVFDITVGGSLETHGYGKNRGRTLVYPNFWKEATYATSEIRIPAQAAIDFGGFGKGWLLDKLAVILEQNGHPYYLINGGGDIAVSSREPLELGLEHPYEPQKIIGTTRITKGSLAASSVVKRRWINNGKTYHHIIDPATAKPADSGVIATYVKGETALIADTLATILLLRPETRDVLSAMFDAKTIIIARDQIE